MTRETNPEKKAAVLRKKQKCRTGSWLGIAGLLLFLSLLPRCAWAESVLKVPDGTTVIQENAFYGDTSLYQVILPDGLTEIQSGAFAGSSVQCVVFPASLRYIADNAFTGCQGVLCLAPVTSTAYSYAAQHPEIFMLDTAQGWRQLISFPTAAEIAGFNSAGSSLAPYIAGWMHTGSVGRFLQYSIDFKADLVPPYTYCSLANFTLDYSALKSTYANVYTEAGIFGYAGLQYGAHGAVPNSILSFWDVYCVDNQGHTTKLQARQVYPEPGDDSTFGGEGEGVHCLVKYNWKPGNWYRMLLQCGVSPDTGNTTLEQWVRDLQTGVWTYLCKYDLGAPGVAMTDDTAVFLENFIADTAGDVRTMEVRNVRVFPESTYQWELITSGYFLQNFDHPGSYRYGTSGDTFWIITTGLSNRAGSLDPGSELEVTGGSGAAPF